METRKATIKRDKSSTKLVLEGSESPYEIILTEDNPNNIKASFNELLKDLKKGVFEYELKDDKSDMYNHISKEYIQQLNSEMLVIYSEMEEYHLTENKRK